MAFKLLSWLYPKLPTIAGITWTPGWPDSFETLPLGSFRVAENSTGVVIDNGEGSANVSVYIDTWAKTPEDRENYDSTITDAILAVGMIRRMTRQTEEIFINGTKVYRSTMIFAGEYDHAMHRMCIP